jgi:hypothetical protein
MKKQKQERTYYKHRHANIKPGEVRELIDRRGNVAAVGKVTQVGKSHVTYRIIAED